MLYKRCLNLSGEYMNPIKPDTLQARKYMHLPIRMGCQSDMN